jgi:ribosomal protein L3 glutamine methyltransferase
VLDLCSGCGCIGILAAMQFPNASVDATELSPGAAEVARRNIEDHGLASRVRLLEGDLFTPVAGRTYDLILANPPYVDREAMQALPAEFRAEPAMALDGGEDGLDVVHRIIEVAPHHLHAGGMLVVEVGRGRQRLEAAYPALPFLWLDTEASQGEVFAISAEALGGQGGRRAATVRPGSRRRAGRGPRRTRKG